MLYVHAFSAIEQVLFRSLAKHLPLAQMDIRCISEPAYVNRILSFQRPKVLIYSFQQADLYKHLDSFQDEMERLKILIGHTGTAGIEKLILLSYPGAYASSDNMFLQHKGLIEQLFAGTGLPCCILRIQGIHCAPLHMNNLHPLFYNKATDAYFVPKKTSDVIYSVNLKNLVDVISTAAQGCYEGTFDVFDKVSSLKHFLHYNSKGIKVRAFQAFYLYIKSYLGHYIAPTMFELFMRTAVPMYNFRTEKAFGVSLHSEMFEHLRPGVQYEKQDRFIHSRREQLLPVT